MKLEESLKLSGKICGSVGLVFLALALTLTIYWFGSMQNMWSDKTTALGDLRAAAKAALSMASLSVISLSASLTLKLVHKFMGKKKKTA